MHLQSGLILSNNDTYIPPSLHRQYQLLYSLNELLVVLLLIRFAAADDADRSDILLSPYFLTEIGDRPSILIVDLNTGEMADQCILKGVAERYR